VARTGGVKVYIDGDTTGLSRALRTGEQRIGRFGDAGTRALRGMTVAAVALGTAGVAGIGYSVKAATDLGEELSKTQVVFRSSGKEVAAWSKTTASALGISRREALAAAGVFGNMLVPMGVARARAADMSQAMVDLAGDMASFNNASPTETLDALRAGLAGETEPLRRFGVFLDAARVKQEAVNLGLSNGTENLTAAAKAQATYSLILKDTKDAQGDASRTGDELAGGMRRLKAQADDVSSSLGTMFIPPLRSGLAFVNNEVVPQLQVVADQLAGVWEREDLTPEAKFEESWKRIEATGFPDAAKNAIYQGITAVATNAPKVFVQGMREAPWPAKAVLAGIFLAKFGPAITMAGTGLGKVLGTSMAGGTAMGARGLAAASPVPVVVTNPGFGGGAVPGGVVTTAAGRRIPMVGGVPGGGLIPTTVPVGAPGMFRPGVGAAAGRFMPGAAVGIGAGSLAYMGLNAAGVPGAGDLSRVLGSAAAGATMGAPAGPPGMIVGALAGATFGGLVAGFKRFQGSGEVESLEKRVQASTDRLAAGLTDQARGRIERATRDLEAVQARVLRARGVTGTVQTGVNPLTGVRIGPNQAENTGQRQIAGLARTQGLAVAQEFTRGLNAGARNITQADLWKATTKRFDALSAEGRVAGARTLIKWAQGAEEAGRVPKGTADRLVADLRRKYGELEADLPKSARKAVQQFNAELASKKATAGFQSVADGLKDAFSDAPRFTKTTMDNVGRQYARAIDFLTDKTKTGTAQQRKDAREALVRVKAAWEQVGDANRKLGRSYDAPRTAVGRLRLAMEGASAATIRVWSNTAAAVERSTNALAKNIEDAADRITRAGRRTRGPAAPGAAGGGFTGVTPGRYTGRDPYMLRVDGDEAILNPRQQEMVPGGRATLTRIFAATGGQIAAYARGGYVNPLPGGSWSGGPDAHRARAMGNWQSDDAWDIFPRGDDRVYAAFPGTIPRISPFSSNGQTWGYGVYLSGAPGQLYYKHLKSVSVRAGQSVSAGTVLGVLGDGVNGGKHLHLGASPVGLLSMVRGGGSPGPAGAPDDASQNGPGRGEPNLTPSQELKKALGAAGITGKAATGIVNRVGQAGADVAGSVTARTGGGDLAGQRAGLSAAGGYLRPGAGSRVSPEDEDAAIEQATIAAEKRHLERDLRLVEAALRKITGRITALRRDEKRLVKIKKKTAGRTRALAAVRKGLKSLRDNQRALLEAHTHIRARLAEIGETQAAFDAEGLLGTIDVGGESLSVVDAAEAIGDVISDAGRDDSLQDKQAAKAGVEEARAAGITNPEEIQARSERAVLIRRKNEVEALAAQVKAILDQLLADRARLMRAWQSNYQQLGKINKRKRPAAWAKRRDAILRINAALELLDSREDALRSQHADLQAQANELGFDIGELDARIEELPDQVADTPDQAGADPGTSPADAAALAAAQRDAGLANAFIRAAFSPGDIGSGGFFAMGAAGGVININTLMPGDPRVLEELGRAVSAAGWASGPILSKSTLTGL
jgi:murein DD-endopeptidase MepM/ murein hydrolase activator NlpD